MDRSKENQNEDGTKKSHFYEILAQFERKASLTLNNNSTWKKPSKSSRNDPYKSFNFSAEQAVPQEEQTFEDDKTLTSSIQSTTYEIQQEYFSKCDAENVNLRTKTSTNYIRVDIEIPDEIGKQFNFHYQLKGLSVENFNKCLNDMKSIGEFKEIDHVEQTESGVYCETNAQPDSKNAHDPRVVLKDTLTVLNSQQTVESVSVEEWDSDSDLWDDEEEFGSQPQLEKYTDIVPLNNIYGFRLRTRIPKVYEEFKSQFAIEDIYSDKQFTKIFDILLSVRRYFEDFEFSYYELFYNSKVCPSSASDADNASSQYSPSANVEHLNNKQREHKQLLDEIVSNSVSFLQELIEIQPSSEYSNEFLGTLTNYINQNYDNLLKYIQNYRKNSFGIQTEVFCRTFFWLLTKIKAVCTELYDDDNSLVKAKELSNIANYLLDETNTNITNQDSIRHLMELKLVFSGAQPPMRLSCTEKFSNRVIAEMQAIIKFTKTVKVPIVQTSFDAILIDKELPETKRCNIFLLEDRIIFAEYSKRSDRQSLYFYSYLPNSKVEPVCIDEKGRKMAFEHMKEESIGRYTDKNRLVFRFQAGERSKQRCYRAKIQEIKKTSIINMREERFVEDSLVNDARTFLALYKDACESYDWDNPEMDASADFVRNNSIRSSFQFPDEQSTL